MSANGGLAPCFACGETKRIYSRSVCGSCYGRATREGWRDTLPMPARPPRVSKGTCSEDGCGERVHAKGLCKQHHHRAWREGKTGKPVEERKRAWGPSDTCEVPNRWTGEPCGEPSIGRRGMCQHHADVVDGLLRRAG